MPTRWVISTSQPVSSRVSRRAARRIGSRSSTWPAGWFSTRWPSAISSTNRNLPSFSTMVATVAWGVQIMMVNSELRARKDAQFYLKMIGFPTNQQIRSPCGGGRQRVGQQTLMQQGLEILRQWHQGGMGHGLEHLVQHHAGALFHGGNAHIRRRPGDAAHFHLRDGSNVKHLDGLLNQVLQRTDNVRPVAIHVRISVYPGYHLLGTLVQVGGQGEADIVAGRFVLRRAQHGPPVEGRSGEHNS